MHLFDSRAGGSWSNLFCRDSLSTLRYYTTTYHCQVKECSAREQLNLHFYSTLKLREYLRKAVNKKNAHKIYHLHVAQKSYNDNRFFTGYDPVSQKPWMCCYAQKLSWILQCTSSHCQHYCVTKGTVIVVMLTQSTSPHWCTYLTRIVLDPLQTLLPSGSCSANFMCTHTLTHTHAQSWVSIISEDITLTFLYIYPVYYLLPAPVTLTLNQVCS